METLLRTLSAAEAAALTEQVIAAVEDGECSSLALPGLPANEVRYLIERAESFQQQCQFLLHNRLTSHPCVTLGDEAVPLSFCPEEMQVAIASTRTDSERAMASALSENSGTRVDMVATEQAKRTFGERFVQFVSAALEWTGHGGGGDDGGNGRDPHDETGGLEITVNSNTHGLQVVYSEHFMIRDKKSENAFGESLTSPVKGRITQPGLYYFGTADNTTTSWARFTFKIPPTRTINLMH